MLSLSRALLCRLALTALGLTCLCMSHGCGISPKPEPPDATLDGNSVSVASEPDRATPEGGVSTLVVSGGPDSASPPGAIVRVYNLDSEDPPVETVVQDDGSFQVEVAGQPQDEVRVQIVTDDARSDPADFQSPPETAVGGTGGTTDGGPEGVYQPPGGQCAVLDPPLELVVSGSGTLQVGNQCTEAIQVDAPYLRRDFAGVSLGADLTWPQSVAPGQSLSITVTIAPGSGFAEEIFFVPVVATALERHAVTLRAAE